MSQTHADYRLSQLDQLEAESIHIFREVAAEFEKPVLMFSGGKDSIVMMRLAEKAFFPAKIPFPVLQVDTGYDFPEVLDDPRQLGQPARRPPDRRQRRGGHQGRHRRRRRQDPAATGSRSAPCSTRSRRSGFTAAFGGGRRDEEKARAKERVYSHRDEFGQWDPKNQRPELWSLYNGRIHEGEHMRIFPISQLDRAGHLGLHRPRGHRDPRPSTSPTSAASSSATGCCSPESTSTRAAGRDRRGAHRPVPHRRRPDPHRLRGVRGRHDRRDHRRDRRRPGHRARRHPWRRPFSEAAMEDRKKEGYF